MVSTIQLVLYWCLELIRMASAAVQTPMRDRRWRTAATKPAKDDSKGIWSSMLDSVATGKKLAEKTLVVLGTNAAGHG